MKYKTCYSLVFLLLINVGFSQYKYTKKDYPFGTYWSINEIGITLQNLDTNYSKFGIVQADSILLVWKGYNYTIPSNVTSSNSLKKIELYDTHFNTLFISNDIKQSILVLNSQIDNLHLVSIPSDDNDKGKYLPNLSIIGSKIVNFLFLPSTTTTFAENIYFGGDTIGRTDVVLSNIVFLKPFTLYRSSIKSFFQLNDINFRLGADFSYTVFDHEANFINISFENKTDFSNSTFKSSSYFDKCSFKDTLAFINSSISNQLDLRNCNLDSLSVLYLDQLNYDNGQLFVYWNQIKGTIKPKIQLFYSDSNIQLNYSRIENIYHKLRDNYLSQGNKQSADEVMYELAWQKDLLLGGFWQSMNGFFLGYGYKPFRLVAFLVIPLILLFSYVWYKFFYHEIYTICIEQQPDKDVITKKGFFKTIPFKLFFKFNLTLPIFNHQVYGHPLIRKLLYSLHFSASVLLGFRIKTSWIRVDNKWFLSVMVIEYMFGKILYVWFAFTIENSQFSLIKSLFEF
ncbi:MAG: pentapeptide repeat-containing protein [Bacteroidetes bacterium]|nr:pentapeptide repeat-containing protein [Bacteroidota bacterium]